MEIPEETQEIKLTKKQEMFCRYYVSNGHNGTQAAISAGYSENSANEQAAQMLAKLSIQEFIKELEKPVLERLGIDENWVINKLKAFADADIADYFEIIGNSIQLKDFATLTPEQRSAIQEISETTNGIKIKLVDKRACVVDLGKHQGMFKEQLEGNINHNHEHRAYVIPAFNDSDADSQQS
jgi:phage terminase small subunit